MNFISAVYVYLSLLLRYTLQQENCIGYSASTANCYDCSFSHNRSPNMTSDNPIYSSNCTPRKNESLYLRSFISTRKCTSAALCNGTEQYPFDEINRAFWVAHSQANERNYTEVEFYFLGSPHYILRKNLPQVNFAYFRRINMNISIMPCYCSFKNISGCFGSGESATVYVKTDSFSLFVANKLFMKNMIFNGTDMHLPTSSSNDVTNCYNKEAICCNFSQRNTVFTTAAKTPCALVQRNFSAAATEKWKNRTSFFSVEPIFDHPSRKKPELLLENITFCDMYTLKSYYGWIWIVQMGSNCLGGLIMKNVTISDVQLIKGVLIATSLEEIITSAADFSAQWSLRTGEAPSIEISNLFFQSFNKFGVFAGKEIGDRFDFGVISLFGYRGTFTVLDSLCDAFIYNSSIISLLHFENSLNIFFNNLTIRNFQNILLVKSVNASVVLNNAKLLNVTTFEGLFLNAASNITFLNCLFINVNGLASNNGQFFVLKNSHLELRNISMVECSDLSNLADSSDFFLFNISIKSMNLVIQKSANFIRQFFSLKNSIFLADFINLTDVKVINYDFILYKSTLPLPCIISNLTAVNITFSSSDSMIAFLRWAEGASGGQLIWSSFFIKDSSIEQLLIAEYMEKLFIRSFVLLNVSAVTVFEISSLFKIFLENLNFSSTYSDEFMMRAALCNEEDGCFLGLHELAVLNAVKLKFDWISLSVTKADLSNIQIQNVSHRDYDFPPRRLFFLNKLQHLQAQNVSLVLYQHSIRCVLELNEIREVRLKGLSITNEWVGERQPEFFVSVLSGNRGKAYAVENLLIKGLMGIPSEASMNYKNGFINFYGSDSDMVKVKTEIVIRLKDVMITDSSGWPYGVMGFSNLANVSLENVIVRNTSSGLKTGGILIIFSDFVDLKGLSFKNTRAIEGGCIYLKNVERLVISEAEISEAFAKDGGAFHISYVNAAVFQDISAIGTSATGKGGLFYLEKVNTSLSSVFTSLCSSGYEGGVLFSKAGRLEVSKASFYNSQSKKGGVALIIQASSITMLSIYITRASSSARGVSLMLIGVRNVVLEDISISFCVGPSAVGNILLENEAKNQPYVFTNVLCWKNEILVGNCLCSKLESDVYVRNLTVKESGGSALYFLSRSGSTVTLDSFSLINNLLGELRLEKDSLGLFQNLEVKLIGGRNLIENNSAATSLLMFDACNVTIENSAFSDNVGLRNDHSYVDISSSGLSLTAKNLNRSLVGKNKSFSSRFLDLKNGEINISSSAISGCFNLERAACINLEDAKRALFQNNIFSSNRGSKIGALYARSSSLTVLNCSFFHNTYDQAFSIENIDGLLQPVELRASDLLFESSILNNTLTLEILECFFSVGKNSLAVVIYKASRFRIEGSIFQASSNKSAAVFFFSCSGEIQHSQFSNFVDEEGGSAIKGMNLNALFPSSLQVNDSLFIRNKAPLGGAILLQGLLLVRINGSAFEQNQATAEDGIGGAIYFTCLSCKNCSIVLSYNIFAGNWASNFAPTVFSQAEIDKTQSVSNIFLDNTDSVGFTRFFSSLPARGVISKAYESDSGREIIWEDQKSTIISGSFFDFNLTLVDHFQQPLIFENSARSTLSKKISESKVQIFGGFGKSSKGIHNFRKTRVVFQPSSPLKLDILVILDEKQFLPRALESTPQGQLVVEWDLFVRPCIVGEVRALGDFSCYYCKEGLFSLIDPMSLGGNETQACRPCPNGASCPGGSELIPKYGYWRAHANSSLIVKCLSPSFCLGGELNDTSSLEKIQGRCLAHHEGRICYKCEQGYARSGTKGICEDCQSNSLLRLKIVVALLLIYCYVILQIKFTFSRESRSSVAILMKQLLTHVQLIQMISVLDLGWTPDILDYFKYQEYFSFLSEEMVSLDCLFVGLEEDDLTLRIIASNLMSPAMTLAVLMTLLTLTLYRKYFRKKQVVVEEFALSLKTSMVVMIYVFLPEILKKGFSPLNCITIDDNYTEVIKLSPENLCWEEKHFAIIYKLSLPAILFWGIFIPISALALLVKNRREIQAIIQKRRELNARSAAIRTHPQLNLVLLPEAVPQKVPSLRKNLKNDNPLATSIKKISPKFERHLFAIDDFHIPPSSQKPPKRCVLSDPQSSFPTGGGVVLVFKFLYRGYKEKYFFWEVVIYIKKFLLTVISSLTNIFPSNTKATILLIIISFFLLLQAKYHPFEVDHLNTVEFLSLLVTFLTANVGIVLLSEELKSYSALFLVFLILINIFFLCYWTFVFTREFFSVFWPGKRKLA